MIWDKDFINKIIWGDYLDAIKYIPNGVVDLIVTDPPYGLTQNPKDIPVNLTELWKELLRVGNENCAFIFTSSQPFTTDLINSNRKMFRYDIIWKKGERTSGFLNVKRMPLRNHETIVIFYRKCPTYNPQMTIGEPLHGKGVAYLTKPFINNNYGEFNVTEDIRKGETKKYPKSIWNFDRPHPPKHATQKPIALMEELIKTYSNEGDIVLDPFAGTGTTLIAAEKSKRKWMGMEIDENNKAIFEELWKENIDA